MWDDGAAEYSEGQVVVVQESGSCSCYLHILHPHGSENGTRRYSIRREGQAYVRDLGDVGMTGMKSRLV